MSLFLPILEAFNRKKVDYVIVGGLAIVLHGHSRMTTDVDLVIGLDEPNASKAVEVVTKLGYRPRVPVDPWLFVNPKQRAVWVKEKGAVVFSFYSDKNPMVGIDFFVKYPMDFKGLLKRSVRKKLGKITVKVGSIEDLIKMKKKVGRAKDLQDVQILRMIKNEKA